MTTHDPAVVRDALTSRLCAVQVGPYRVEYINTTAPSRRHDGDELAVVERGSHVTDVVELGSETIASWVEYYGADGVEEQY